VTAGPQLAAASGEPQLVASVARQMAAAWVGPRLAAQRATAARGAQALQLPGQQDAAVRAPA
jgi:hypothetical protein